MDESSDHGIYADRFGGLRLPGKRLARAVARHAWIESHGSGDDAVLLFRDDFRVRSLDPALIALLLQLAILLFQHWSRRKIDEPSVVGSEDEPIDWENENDAD